jgi:uncharacterized RDD family membrane protein YckC
MTDPAGGAPTPPSSNWQTPPPPAPGGSPTPPSSNWQTPPPAAPGGFQPGNFQQSNVEAGPAPGVSYADTVNRVIAAVIDAVILWVVNFILIVIAGIIAVAGGNMGLIVGLLFGAIFAVVNAVYFVYGWTKMRASFGQKFLNLETVNAADGATLTQNQAIRRWAFLFGPWAVGAIIPILGIFIELLAGLYVLYLLYTVTQSPKRQGYHDLQAGTVVVKRG